MKPKNLKMNKKLFMKLKKKKKEEKDEKDDKDEKLILPKIILNNKEVNIRYRNIFAWRK